MHFHSLRLMAQLRNRSHRRNQTGLYFPSILRRITGPMTARSLGAEVCHEARSLHHHLIYLNTVSSSYSHHFLSRRASSGVLSSSLKPTTLTNQAPHIIFAVPGIWLNPESQVHYYYSYSPAILHTLTPIYTTSLYPAPFIPSSADRLCVPTHIIPPLSLPFGEKCKHFFALATLSIPLPLHITLPY